MFERLFKEIFGNVNFEELDEALSKAEKCDDNQGNNTYYHMLEKKYENGKCVFHKEKEIKDGKVVKDLNYSSKIEDKRNDSTEKKAEPSEVKVSDNEKALNEANKTIERQNNVINDYKKYCAELEERLNKINKLTN